MLSVVVIGRNEAATLAECLVSVHDALARVSYELLYIDSGSTDGSPDIALQYGARCFRLRTADTTAALARSIGAREARGEHLLFLDGDMQLERGFIETAVTVLDTSKLDGACGIRRDVYLRAGEVVGENPNYFGCHKRRKAPEFGGAILLRASALAQAGGWAPNVLACEEAELHARLLKQRSYIVELPIPMIQHTDQVRDNRGVLGTLISRRRLGLGQALVNALRKHSAWALLKREKLSFLCWLLDALCVAALCLGGLRSLTVVAIAQALQMLAFALMGRLRGFVGQKLLFFYLPIGMCSYHRRDEGYTAYEAPAPLSARAPSPRAADA